MYSIWVFLHIVGALGLFAGIALEQAALQALLIVATGIYMATMHRGHQAWIGLALLLGAGLTARRPASHTSADVATFRSPTWSRPSRRHHTPSTGIAASAPRAN